MVTPNIFIIANLILTVNRMLNITYNFSIIHKNKAKFL